MFSNSSVLLHISNNDSSVTNGVPDYSTQDCLQHSSTGETVLKSQAYFIIIVLSLVGNGCILLVIYKNKNLRRNINFFVLNMAVSDLQPADSHARSSCRDHYRLSVLEGRQLLDTGKHFMQALLLSSWCFLYSFYRESTVHSGGQVHRCGFSAEGKTLFIEGPFGLYWLHMDNCLCRSRTLFFIRSGCSPTAVSYISVARAGNLHSTTQKHTRDTPRPLSSLLS